MSDLNGYRLASPMEQRFKERKLAAVMTTFCICGKRFDGTARECIKKAAKHRARAHPEMVDRGQKARVAAAKAAPVVHWSSRTPWGEM